MSNLFSKSKAEPFTTGAHRDYPANLSWARRFIIQAEPKLQRGIRVAITDSHHLPSTLLMISWTPPRHAPVGNYAVPVFMHAQHTQFTRKVEAVFEHHIAMANNFFTKFPAWEVQSA